MRNLWLVVRREYISRFRSGGYVVSTVVMMLLLFGSTLIPAVFERQNRSEPLQVLLLDRTGQVAAPLQEALKVAPDSEGGRPVTLEVVSGDEASYQEQVRKGEKALLVVEGTFPGAVKARFLAGSGAVLQESPAVLGPLEGLIRSARMQARGIDPSVAMEIMRPMEAEVKQISARDGERDQREYFGLFTLAVGAAMSIYIIVLLNGSFVFQGVLEEKVSRVMEVMASTVRPAEMLAGKVIGLGALGLTQFVLLGAAWGTGNTIANRLTDAPSTSVSLSVLGVLLVYLVLGYALSAVLMAAAASTISRMEDSQTMMMPITMLQVIPMVMMMPVINDPNGSLAFWMSLIPFFSPMIMVVRTVMTDVPAWQVALSMTLLVLATAGMAWAGSRVYRAAMLSYGGRPSFRQILNYLRAG